MPASAPSPIGERLVLDLTSTTSVSEPTFLDPLGTALAAFGKSVAAGECHKI